MTGNRKRCFQNDRYKQYPRPDYFTRFRILLHVQTFLSVPNLLSLRVHIWAWKEAMFKDAISREDSKRVINQMLVSVLWQDSQSPPYVMPSMRLTRKRSERTETTLKRWLMCFSGLQHSEVTVSQQRRVTAARPAGWNPWHFFQIWSTETCHWSWGKFPWL